MLGIVPTNAPTVPSTHIPIAPLSEHPLVVSGEAASLRILEPVCHTNSMPGTVTFSNLAPMVAPKTLVKRWFSPQYRICHYPSFIRRSQRSLQLRSWSTQTLLLNARFVRGCCLYDWLPPSLGLSISFAERDMPALSRLHSL